MIAPPELPRRITISGVFQISVPASTSHEVVDDGSTIALDVRPGCEAVYIKRFDLPSQYSTIPDALEAEARRFLSEGIGSVCPTIIGSSVDAGAVNDSLYAQLVVALPGSRWWLARFVAKPGSKSYFLLHCHGDEDYLVLATAMFCEFYILE